MDVTSAYRAAARIDEQAGVVRVRAQLAAALAESLDWHSLAGSAFRERARTTCLDLVGLGSAMQQLAEAIRRRATLLAAVP